MGSHIKIRKTCVSDYDKSRYNAHTEPVFKHLHQLMVKDIFDERFTTCWYKFVNKKIPNYFHDIFEYNYEVQKIGSQPAQVVLDNFCDIT